MVITRKLLNTSIRFQQLLIKKLVEPNIQGVSKNKPEFYQHIIYSNVSSFLAHKADILTGIVCYLPYIIILVETCVTKDIGDAELQIDQYQMLRCDSTSRQTGGVLCYIREDIVIESSKVMVVDMLCWCLFVKIKLGNTIWNVGGLYRSPSSSKSKFINFLEDVIENNFGVTKNCILVGDFNFNFFGNDFYEQKVKNLLTLFSLDQVVTDFTRCVNDSNTLIDFVVTNYRNVYAHVHEPTISEHCVLSVSLFNNYSSLEEKYIVTRKLDQAAFHNINMGLISCEWNTTSTNVDILLQKILDNIGTVVDNVAPEKKIIIKSHYVPYFDNDLKQLRRDRNNAYTNFKNSNSCNKHEMWCKYKSLRNSYVDLLKKKEKLYYEQKIDNNKNNYKQMWKCLKELVKPNQTRASNIQFEINNQNVILRNDIEIAENFNLYFVNSITNIMNSFTDSNEWSPDEHYPNIFGNFSEFHPLTLNQLRKIVFSLDKTNKSEILNNKILTECFGTIGYQVLEFINTSLRTGVFPDEFKVATVVPIPKINNSTEAKNYRPLNILPTLEKILELAVYDQISEYFKIHDLFLGCQSGFRARHSCETSLQFLITEWKNAIDKDNYIVATFLDLQRAFETIDRTILLQKLQYYGITRAALDWFKSYLSDRRQKTKYGKNISSEVRIENGVPQGSVLGPLLFIIYINDINLVAGLHSLNLFADDTLLYCTHKNLDEAVISMNKSLKNIEIFLIKNKLKLNVNKTKSMIITTNYKYNHIHWDDIQLEINSKKIEFVSEIKYLGVIIDKRLNFNSHSEYINKKISVKLYFLSRICKRLSMYAKLTLYNSLIQPHFDYCATLLFMLDKNKIDQLQKLQNRGLRLLLGCNRYTSINFMLNALNWLSVKDRIFFVTMVFVFKLSKGLQPNYLNKFCVLNQDIHGHNVRKQDNFYLNRTKTKFAMNCVFFNGLNKFNVLPYEIKNAKTIGQFKKLLKIHLVNRIL